MMVNTCACTPTLFCRGATGAGGRVRPVNLVGLANVHADAVCPVVLGREPGVSLVEVVALEAEAGNAKAPRRVLSAVILLGKIPASAVLVELAHGKVLGTVVPVHIDRAEAPPM